MTRKARIVLPGRPHHITQRGTNRQQVFFSDEDRRVYLRILRKKCLLHKTEILAYCLMPNHIHLVGIPGQSDSLALVIGQTHGQYTQYINREQERSGHLWQSRYFSVALDHAHLVNAMRYVERNPVRAKLVTHPWEFEWSSAAAHCGARDPAGLIKSNAWSEQYPPEKWKPMLQVVEDEAECEAWRMAFRRGIPTGQNPLLGPTHQIK